MCITSFWFTEYIYVYYIVGYCYLIRQNTSRKIVFNGYIFAFSDATKTTISPLFSRKAKKASSGPSFPVLTGISGALAKLL
jgi:hypothetical protein